MRKVVPVIFLLAAASAFGHPASVHHALMDYSVSKAGELPVPLTFDSAQTTRMREGSGDEDNGVRSLDHAWNPLSGRIFPLGISARDAAADRWNRMANAFLAGDFNGGDDAGAWHYLGRASHLVQDMTSPLHVFAIQHLNPTCQFEVYWDNNIPSLHSFLTDIGGPLHSNTLDAKSTEKLDDFSAQRLRYRFDHSCPNKNNDDIRGWAEVVTWTTYFRATFWGEMKMGADGSSGVATSPLTTGTTFEDGFVAPETNSLHTMFPNNVFWINNWLIGDDYFEIADRNSNIFRWMSWSDVDDFSSCGSPDVSDDGWSTGYLDSSILIGGKDNDDNNVRSTGRFFFDLRELGRSDNGTFNRFCYPKHYPNGDAMTEHLHDYFCAQLNPLLVRYNAGLLGLANRRIVVKTADTIAADNFAWSRRDNFAKDPLFATGSTGSNFYFVAKSEVTLTAPATNQIGRAFHHWLKDGVAFSGNTNRTLTVNTAEAPIPAGGVVYTADFHTDLDSDGMPDWWEQEHFGGDADPNADSDGDGLDNRYEYLAGTVPTDSASAFRIVSISGFTLTWSSLPGKTYQVIYAASPAGPWQEDLPGSQITAQAGEIELTYTDSNADNETQRFYRVRLVLP